MNLFKKSPKIIIGTIFLILIVFSIYKFYIIRYSPTTYFNDSKVVALCRAAVNADTNKIDKLLNEGVNINYIGKDNFTPLSWLFYTHKQKKSQKVKDGFKYLLEKGADPLLGESKKLWPVFHASAQYEDSSYLKMILENGVEDVDAELEKSSSPTPLLQAMMTDRFENFKLLLDYGADIEWQGALGRTPLIESKSTGSWEFVYYLLQRGADYTVKEKEDYKPEIVYSLEGIRFSPSGSVDYYGTDYRQKCVEFLRKKGVEVHPWMPEGEKYVTEDGEDVLYIKENGQWVKYKESEKYKKKKQEEESQSWLQKWIYKKFYK